MKTMNNEQAASVAQTAIGLWDGFIGELWPRGGNRDLTPEEEKRYQEFADGLGQDSLAFSIGLIAVILEEEVKKWADRDFPSVYQYDVIEPFGKWLATQPEIMWSMQFNEPKEAEIRQHYNEMMAAWFVTDKLTRTRYEPDR